MRRRAQSGHKYIFVVGGVMSGVGKGIAAASVGKLLTARGLSVNLVKIDPYLNVDAGTMNPIEHGEVFVLDSGLETDQDMGNYERFLGRDLGPEDYMTSGMVYKTVIERERNLAYGGKCVEAIPHVRDEIVGRLESSARKAKSDVTVVEIGGTLGDFSNALFIDAARVMHLKHPSDVLFIMVSYLPVPSTIGEMKTKPTQNAVRQLNAYGVQPDIIIARSKHTPDFSEWKRFADHAHNGDGSVKIGIVGKYFDTGDFVLSDAYISVIEAIKFSAYVHGVKPEIDWLNAKNYESNPASVSELKKYDGVIVPGGFGETGIEGKINAIRFVRENKIPYFGLCYGLHMAIIEYARNVLGFKDANTTEINPKTSHPVIDILPGQREKLAKKDYGGSMRLGAYSCDLVKGTIVQEAYGTDKISE